MAKRYGKCTNIGNCDYADQKKVFEILDGQNFVCPNGCPGELHPVPRSSGGGGTNSKALKITALVVIWLIVMFFIVKAIMRPKKVDDVCNKLPFVAQKDMTVVCDKSYKMTKGDTLIKKNGKYELRHPASASPSSSNPVTTACTIQSGLLSRLKSGSVGPMIVGMEEDSEPMYWFDDDDKVVGFGYEFAKELTKRLHVNDMRTVEATYENLPGLLNERAHIVVAGYIKDPEIPNVLWSDSYLENGLCLIVKAGSAITNFRQLNGKKIGLFKGDTPTKNWVTENVPNATIDDTHDETGWLRLLNDRTWDAIIYDYIYAASEIKAFPNLRIVQFNLKPIEYSILIPCNNEDLLTAINREIPKIKGSIFYKNLYEKYLNTNPSNIQLTELPEGPNVHEVKRGETLGTIARDELGDSQKYMDIYNLNKDRLASPHLIYPRTKLKLPLH